MGNISIATVGEKCFSVDDVVSMLKKQGKIVSKSLVRKEIEQKLKNNKIIRIGRSRYIYNLDNKKKYEHIYSDYSININKKIKNRFPLVEYTIFETIQLNEFLNHQIAHNTIFISVEKDLENHVFNMLKNKYPGKVLIDPSKKEYNRYWVDNLIVINKLITESPKNKNNNWVKIEKMLVDIYRNEIESCVFSKSELKTIFTEVLDKYVVDRSSLYRYARRRNVEKDLKSYINDKIYLNGRELEENC